VAENGRPGRGDAPLVASLAAGASERSAAKAGEVSERTVHRRLEDPTFRKAVEEARADIVRRAVAMLSAASTEAVDALRALLGSEMDFARLAAARAILELGLKMREQHDLAERVAALEARLSATPEREATRWSRTG
jgi:hypothetical protein